MNRVIEDFITNHIAEIDANEWDAVYKSAISELSGEGIGDFTTSIYAAGIDPLAYLEYVPQHYLYYSTLVNPELPEGIKEIDHAAFSNSAIEALDIPNSCERVFSHACSSCEQLKSVHLGDTVKSIGANAFFNCRNLSEINFPKSLFEISAAAFKYCDKLPEVIELNENLEIIRPYAFELAEPRTYIIPKSVRRLHQDAFLPIRDTKLIIDKENTYAQEWAEVNGYEYEVR